MAGRMAVTSGNNKVYTYLRINLHMHEWGHIVLVFFPFFLLVQRFPFLSSSTKISIYQFWNWTEIVHKKQVKLYSCYDATGISDYITMAIYGKGLKITKSGIIFTLYQWKFLKIMHLAKMNIQKVKYLYITFSYYKLDRILSLS